MIADNMTSITAENDRVRSNPAQARCWNRLWSTRLTGTPRNHTANGMHPCDSKRKGNKPDTRDIHSL
jgi:hypothetical protein